MRLASVFFFLCVLCSAFDGGNSNPAQATLCSLFNGSEYGVTVVLTDHDLALQSDQPDISLRISYASITLMKIDRARGVVASQTSAVIGAVVPGVAIAQWANPRFDWLVIESAAPSGNEVNRILLLIDTKRQKDLVPAIEKASGKTVTKIKGMLRTLDPSYKSHNVSQELPYSAAQVHDAALHAMSDFNCKVKNQNDSSISCQRPTFRTAVAVIVGLGGETVNIRFTPRGDHAYVEVKTEKISASSHNWSTPIFQDIQQRLR